MQDFRHHWNKFVLENPAGSFLQSYDWGVFQNDAGHDVHFVVTTEKKSFTVDFEGARTFRGRGSDKWRIAALVLTHTLPFGKTYLYAPRGPLVNFLALRKPVGVLETFLREIQSLAGGTNAIFFRMDPEWPASVEMKKFLRGVGLRETSKDIQPRETIILDLTKSEDEILGAMHSKTRYNIRLAERRGVAARQLAGEEIGEKFDEAWALFQETAKRDKFHLHSRLYYERMLGVASPTWGPDPQRGARPGPSGMTAELFVAEYKNKIVAANIVAFFGRRATYLHGVSSDAYRNMMAPYLLHWDVVKEAKKRGCTEYDLWGISEKKWPGVTRFKRGFGGDEVAYVGTYDHVFDNTWYRLYALGQGARRMVP